MRLELGVRIALRDGVSLSANLYLPQTLPAPCILTLTPYIADTHHERGAYFSKHGYIAAIVDVRGRGNSDGSFRPFIQEANDGHDVVEWLAAQPFCNGRIGMSGGSYLGHAQWMTASRSPPHLKTIVPAASPYLGLDFPMRNNIFYPYLAQWFSFIAGATAQTKLFCDREWWSERFRSWHESGHSFLEMNELPCDRSSTFNEWLEHPHPDAYWDAHNPTNKAYARLDLPILTITGSYDDDQPGALEHYRLHLANAPPTAAQNHYLVIGPWDHQGTSVPKREFGGLTFGVASLIDIFALQREWYDWTMSEGPKPAFLKDRVAYYVMGAERWRYTESLDAVTEKHESYYLDSDAPATDVFGAGHLRATPGTGKPDSYRFDPSDPQEAWVQAEASTEGGSLIDQRPILALRDHVLVYHSPPFDEPTETSGFFRLTAWISIDTPDTDIYASVYEITSEDTSIRLSTDALRARYREDPRTPKRVQTTKPLRYIFSRFTFVSRLMGCGSRLRLVLAPVGRLVETTFAERNFNAGGRVAAESRALARPVTVTLFHDKKHPSILHVPRGHNP